MPKNFFSVKPRSGHDFNSLHAKQYCLIHFIIDTAHYRNVPRSIYIYKSNGYFRVAGSDAEESNDDGGLFCH
jgi:hypothetical protein